MSDSLYVKPGPSPTTGRRRPRQLNPAVRAALDLLRPVDLMVVLNSSKSAVEVVRRRGDFPKPFIVNGRPRYRRAEIEAWLERQRRA